jgi:hypothetical protein
MLGAKHQDSQKSCWWCESSQFIRTKLAAKSEATAQVNAMDVLPSARPSAAELAREQIHLHPPVHVTQQNPSQQIESLRPQHEISTGHDLGLSL